MMSTADIPTNWAPSAEAIAALRSGLAEMDHRSAEMRALPPLGEIDLDQAWSELIEAFEAANDRIRRLLDAGDWPTLLAELLEARAAAGEPAAGED